jgi:hypothetical protein
MDFETAYEYVKLYFSSSRVIFRLDRDGMLTQRGTVSRDTHTTLYSSKALAETALRWFGVPERELV